MFPIRNVLVGIVIAMIMVLTGCGGSDSTEKTTQGGNKTDPTNNGVVSTSLQGVAQKGPFLTGAEITLCKVDEQLLCTGEVLNTKVSDDKGSYELVEISWSGLSKLSISGNYLDEVTGEASLSSVTISAIIDIEPKIENNKNVNLLTHMRSLRMKELISSDKTLEEAYTKSHDEVKEIFNVHSDDFTELDLTNFSLGNASLNAELLRLSAAVARSSDPLGDLEVLLKLYNEGGLSAVLNSSLYQQLMSDIEVVNINDTLTSLDVDASAIDLGAVNISPFARASMHVEGLAQSSNKVVIQLFSSSFNTSSPNISVVYTGEAISIINTEIADDYKSIVLEMDSHISCSSQRLTFTLDYIDVDGVDALPLVTNELPYTGQFLACPDDDTEYVPIVIPDSNNEAPIVSISPDINVDITVGDTVSLQAVASDEDGDEITVSWKLKESSSSKYETVPTVGKTGFSYTFNNAGTYIVAVEAKDESDASASAQITVIVSAKIIAPVNHDPIVSISPNMNVEITAGDSITLKSSASDEDGDNTTVSWKLKESASSEYTIVPNFGATGFIYTFNNAGIYLVVVEAYDGKGGVATAEITVTVTEKPTLVMTLADINLSVMVKGSDTADTGEGHTRQLSIHENASHGEVYAYLVGGEFWSIQYTSADCYIGQDSFIYKVGDDYGRVIVDITSPSTLEAPNISRELLDTESVDSEYLTSNQSVVITFLPLRGELSLAVTEVEDVHYSYSPLGTSGSDFFDYQISESINQCTYTDTGRVTLNVVKTEKKLLGLCLDPENIGQELYQTDGTLSGTSLVRDIGGSGKSGVKGFISDEYKIGDLLYFHADDGDRELWINEGGYSTFETNINTSYGPKFYGNSYPSFFKVADDKLYFMAAGSETEGYGVYMADGTSITRLSDLVPTKNTTNHNGTIDYSEELNAMFFFINENGTSTLKKANMDFSIIEDIVAHEDYDHDNLESIGDNFYYQIRKTDSTDDVELWVKRAAVATAEAFNGEHEFQRTLLKAENKIFASGHKKAQNDDPFDEENLKTRLFELTNTGERELFSMKNGTFRYLTYLKGEVFFIWWHYDSSTGDWFHELYKYNISTEAVTPLKTIARGIYEFHKYEGPMLHDMYKFEDKIFIRSTYVGEELVDDRTRKEQLWVSDGTAEGTNVMVEKDVEAWDTATTYNHFTINDKHFMQDVFGFVYKTDYTKSGTEVVIPNACHTVD